jgi:hypothetical protein
MKECKVPRLFNLIRNASWKYMRKDTWILEGINVIDTSP